MLEEYAQDNNDTSYISAAYSTVNVVLIMVWGHKLQSTVSHFSYAPFFQGPHFLAKMVESNIVDDNLFIDILSV